MASQLVDDAIAQVSALAEVLESVGATRYAEFFVIDRGHPGTHLDRLEEYYIRQGGGPTKKGNPDGGLSNKRHQMNDQRYLDAGGDPY